MAAKQPLNKRAPVKRTAKSTARKGGSEVNLVKLELAYRTTTKTLEQLGAANGISRARVCQLAKEFGWSRGDMQDQVRARAEAKVAEQASKVAQGTDAAVEATATLMADTILRERRDVERLVGVANALLTELQEQGKKPKGRQPKGGPKRDPLPLRIDSFRKITDAMTRLTTLERQVLNITPNTSIDPTKRVAEAVESGFAGLRAAFDKRLGKAAAA